jgi:hypothetical protein
MYRRVSYLNIKTNIPYWIWKLTSLHYEKIIGQFLQLETCNVIHPVLNELAYASMALQFWCIHSVFISGLSILECYFFLSLLKNTVKEAGRGG